MLSPIFWSELAQKLSTATGQKTDLRCATPVSGGCINMAYRLECTHANYFVKAHPSNPLSLFAAEALSLQTLAATHTLRVPQVMWYGEVDGLASLVLEWLDLRPTGNARRLGEQLAALHQLPQTGFGWPHDNWIGSTPQRNPNTLDWPVFWRDARLRPQLQLAVANAYPTNAADLAEQLLENIEAFFSGSAPQASLLHGDLWSGNLAWTTDGMPVIFDPASYVGDSETDLALTELFGGFDAQFYAAYTLHRPLSAEYPVRKHLYNLYHVLNHYNLFGGDYGTQAQKMVAFLIAQIRG